MKYIQANRLAKYLFSNLGKEPIKSLLKIVSKQPINHDCYIYKLQFVDTPIPLTIGQHLIIV
jgi:NAD(P)H-flavin reductase